METTQEFKVKIDKWEAIVTVKLSGWLIRRKREVVYDLSQIPKPLVRKTYSMLEKHVAEKLKKKSFEFHIHFHVGL